MRLFLDWYRAPIAEHLAESLREAGWRVMPLPAHLGIDQIDLGPGPAAAIIDGARPAPPLTQALRRWRSEGLGYTIIALAADGGDAGGLLEAGADDFVLPPFDPQALHQRLVARCALSPCLSLPPCQVALDTSEAVWPQGRRPLTSTETRLLRYFQANAGRAIPREELLTTVWGYHPEVDTRAVALAISRLRKKIEVDPQSPRYLHTVYGIGYRLDLAPPQLGTLAASPPPPSDLFGRSALLASLIGKLRAGQPILALHGPGGVGKSHLALSLAAQLSGERAVTFCELSPGADAPTVMATLAAQLGVRPGLVDETTRALCRVLTGTGALVVLDGCEGVLAELGPLLTKLGRLAGVQLLLTTRLRLPLPIIEYWPVEGLNPEAGAELFMTRASAARPDLTWGEDACRKVARIVAAVDGLPLAIELAASRARLLTVHQIAEGLAHPLQLLRRPTPTGRHAAMEHTLASSWALLSAPLQRFLGALSVIQGSFDLPTAAQITGAKHAPLDELSLLADHSLLRLEGQGQARRYRLADPVREFAADRSRDDDAAHRHLQHFIRVAEDLRHDLHGPEAIVARKRYLTVHEDLRAAYAFACENDPASAPTLLFPMCEISWLVGETEALNLIYACPPGPFNRIRAGILQNQASFLSRLGRRPEAHTVVDTLLAQAKKHDMSDIEGEAYGQRATLTLADGQIDATLECCHTSLRLMTGPGQARQRAVVIKTLGVAHRLNGRLSKAHSLLLEAVDICEDAMAAWQVAMLRGSLAIIEHRLGHSQTAVRNMTQCLAFFRALGDGCTQLTAQWNLCIFHLDQGDLPSAAAALAAADALAERFGTDGDNRNLTCLRGQLALERGELQTSLEVLTPTWRAQGSGAGRWQSYALSLEGWALALSHRLGPAVQAVQRAREAADARHNSHQVGRLYLQEAMIQGAWGEGAQARTLLKLAQRHLLGSEAPDTPELLALAHALADDSASQPQPSDTHRGAPSPFPELRWARRLIDVRARARR